MREEALKKLGAELNDKAAKWSPKAGAVKGAVHEALVTFCGQNEEFAQAVAQSEKTLSAVCEECVKNVGTSVSDLEVYRSAENRKLRLAADPVMQRFRRYFDDFREAYAGMKTVIAEAEAENEAETAEKLTTALTRMIAEIREEWK